MRSLASRFTSFLHPFFKALASYFGSLTQYTPVDPWRFRWIYLGMVIVFLIGGIALLFLKKVRPALRERLSTFFWINFGIGLILFFFRDQDIPLFGMDFWRFIHDIAIWVWLIYIVVVSSKEHPRLIIQEKVNEYRNKYLPKAKTVR